MYILARQSDGMMACRERFKMTGPDLNTRVNQFGSVFTMIIVVINTVISAAGALQISIGSQILPNAPSCTGLKLPSKGILFYG